MDAKGHDAKPCRVRRLSQRGPCRPPQPDAPAPGRPCRLCPPGQSLPMPLSAMSSETRAGIKTEQSEGPRLGTEPPAPQHRSRRGGLPSPRFPSRPLWCSLAVPLSSPIASSLVLTHRWLLTRALINLQIFNYLITSLGVKQGTGSSRWDTMLSQSRGAAGGSRGDGPRVGRDTEIPLWKWIYLNSASAPTSRPSSLSSPYNLSLWQTSRLPGCWGFFSPS